jgi:hypothetical protein
VGQAISLKGVENVLSAYRAAGSPKWALFCGQEIQFPYNGDSMEEGEQELLQFLTLLEAGGSKAVYTLKVYYDDVKQIDKKTPNKGAVPFVLNDEPQYRTGKDGNVIITAPNQQPQGMGMNNLWQENKELRAKIDELKDQIYKLQLAQIQKDVSHQIAGLNKADDMPWWEKGFTFIDKLTDKPDAMAKITDIFRNITGQPPARNWDPPARETRINVNHQMSGVSPEAAAPPVEPEPEENGEIFMREMLTPTEWNQRNRMDIILEKLRALEAHEIEAGTTATEESQLMKMQEACLESIAETVGDAVLTLMLLRVQAMTKKEREQLLNHMMT